jgi:hypothetical protein
MRDHAETFHAIPKHIRQKAKNLTQTSEEEVTSPETPKPTI